MADLFSLFIKPASSGVSTYDFWHRKIAFGSELPPALVRGGNLFSPYTHLEASSVDNADVFAVIKGTLSVNPPSSLLLEELESKNNQFTSDLPVIYLVPDTIKLHEIYKDSFILNYVNSSSYNLSEPLESRFYIDDLKCFVYFNLDLDELRNALFTSETDDAKWKAFLSGEEKILVKSGDSLGKAGKPYLLSPDNNVRQFSFGVLSKYGVHDPGFFCEIAGQAVLRDDPNNQNPLLFNELANNVLGVYWPVIPSTDNPDVVGVERTFPYSVLLQYKNDANLSYSQWRALGDRQKAIYLKRLLRRTRPSLAPADTPHFEFNMNDIHNVFQLEAITEFYANFTDPWKKGTTPKLPGSDGYRRVNFLPLYGSVANVAGKEVKLELPPEHVLCLPTKEVQLTDPNAPFSIIFPERDILTLYDDTKRTYKSYRILNFDPNTHVLELDEAPQVNGTSSWSISGCPILVLIDAFGARIDGKKAVKIDDTTVRINFDDDFFEQQKKCLKQTNSNFDTFGLISVDNPEYEHEFRIKSIEVNEDHAILKIYKKELNHMINDSPWCIPAGIGGKQIYNAFPKTIDGKFDNYDGVLFMVLDGRIDGIFPWSSYTSRDKTGQGLSSIRGNAFYHVISFLSTNIFINFSFKVLDEISGIPSSPFIRDSAPYWNNAYDGVRENRYYFSSPVKPDSVNLGSLPSSVNGKTKIRLHHGCTKRINGSEGCCVSPKFDVARQKLIEHYIRQEKDFPFENDSTESELRLIRITYSDNGNSTCNNKRIQYSTFINNCYPTPTNNQRELWDSRIQGFFWLIRPDELPEGEIS